MFKFPFNWLAEESDIEVSKDGLLEWLDLQGFEIASLEDCGDDTLIEIEVKANRPDMLSVAGVLREYYISKSMPAAKEFDADLNLTATAAPAFSHAIRVLSDDVRRYCAIEINGLDNKAPTPPHIKRRLEKLGVPSINPVVDVSNYVLLRMGQPTHIFDADKVRGAITIGNTEAETHFVSLGDTDITVPAGALLIRDEEGPICLAGIIGGHKAEVDADTKNIIIESANFAQIVERTTSKKTKVSTAASYRYERGVDMNLSPAGARVVAEMVAGICGGVIRPEMFDHNPSPYVPQTLELTRERTNRILGSGLSLDEIAAFLEKCYFKTRQTDAGTLVAEVPHFRLDVALDVDLIEEVGRMYGYHNIEPQEIKLHVPYAENPVHKNAGLLRDVMVGNGFIEVLTYGFIPADAMRILCLHEKNDGLYADIHIQNPLSGQYELMRPTLAYNLIHTALRNLSIGSGSVKIFEIGKTFRRDPALPDDDSDAYPDRNMFAMLCCGVKHPKGFGVGKDVPFSIYDAAAVLHGIFDEYNIKYDIKNTDEIGLFEEGAGAEIFIGGERAGVIGKISGRALGNFEYGKLAKEDMLYLEFCFDGLRAAKKSIAFESDFPGIMREYNFIVRNGVAFSDYKAILCAESPFVTKAEAVDVYFGKGVPEGSSAVLLRVWYNAAERTLSAEEVEQIEDAFKGKLLEKFGMELKA
ncbi:MAG: phenylalanine--tRNA ligase subunit beta [Clostridiales Family XIII bacterium]|jgi:phenylalanyl-tRNA synthetase beta chain|nr:phenylalanine--tRNA ligase subunit beta [Clostridiales Family XIII bacterium]